MAFQRQIIYVENFREKEGVKERNPHSRRNCIRIYSKAVDTVLKASHHHHQHRHHSSHD